MGNAKANQLKTTRHIARKILQLRVTNNLTQEKFSQKINTKLKQIENLKNTHEERKKRYSIVDNAALEAGRILAQYANMQCVIAEVPPSYAVITGGKLKQAMAESTTLSNPVSCLITINAISNMQAKNNSLDEKHLERGKGATQLYSIAILLNQIEKNNDKMSENTVSKIIETLKKFSFEKSQTWSVRKYIVSNEFSKRSPEELARLDVKLKELEEIVKDMPMKNKAKPGA